MNLREDVPDQKKKRHLVLFHILPTILEHPMTHIQLLQALRKHCGTKGCVKAPEGTFAGWIAKLIWEGVLVQTGSQGEHVYYSFRKDIMEVFALLEGESVPVHTGRRRIHRAGSVAYQKILGFRVLLGRIRRYMKAG